MLSAFVFLIRMCSVFLPIRARLFWVVAYDVPPHVNSGTGDEVPLMCFCRFVVDINETMSGCQAVMACCYSPAFGVLVQGPQAGKKTKRR
jgi:hypothetical protein